MPGGDGRRRYGKLSLQKKIEIIKFAEMGYSQRALASRYNCGKTQIHLLVTQKAMWLDKWQRAQNGNLPEESYHISEDQPTSYNNLNDLVFDFHAKLTSSGIPVSGSMLQERAMQVAKELHQFDFSADHDWLLTFVSHYDLALGEDDNNTLTLLKSIGSKAQEDSLIQDFELCDIYNLGEVRLPYKFVPSDRDSIQPTSPKDYLTVSLCFNAMGGKEAELIVYDSAQHGEVNPDLHSRCISNWKGMMTQSLYEKCLTKLNTDMSQQNRRILLLVDESKFTGSLECSMSNVKVKPTSVYLPSPPLLCSIGNMFKFLYCRNLLRMLLAHSSNEGNVLDLAEKLALSKAVGLIQSAWDEMHPKTIQNSFFEAGLKHFKSDSEDLSQTLESDEALIQEIKNLVCLLHKKGSFEELSDSLFTPLIGDNFSGSAIGDGSDSDDEEFTQGTSDNNDIITDQNTLYKSAQPSLVFNQKTTAAIPAVNSLVNEALPYISRLENLSDVIFSKAELPRVKLLLNELGSLFEDAIADYKFKDNKKL